MSKRRRMAQRVEVLEMEKAALQGLIAEREQELMDARRAAAAAKTEGRAMVERFSILCESLSIREIKDMLGQLKCVVLDTDFSITFRADMLVGARLNGPHEERIANMLDSLVRARAKHLEQAEIIRQCRDGKCAESKQCALLFAGHTPLTMGSKPCFEYGGGLPG